MSDPKVASALLAPAEIVKLLADPARLRVVSALALGAVTLDGVQQAASLDIRQAVTALTKLVDGGLVEQDAHGYRLREEDLRAAARVAAPAPADEHTDASPDDAKVLRAFVRDRRLLQIPASHGKRQVVLDLIVQDFEVGHRYSERQINLLLGQWHADYAALRRYLVDDGFMDREGGFYWRTGGTVSIED